MMNAHSTDADDQSGASGRPSPLPDKLLALALDVVSEGSLITDAQQRIIYANNAITAITGYSAAEMLGRSCALLQGAGSDQATIQRMRDSFTSGETFRGDILNYRKDGTPFWNALTITPLRDAAGTTTHFVSVQRDISPLIELQDRLRHQATHDPVTELPNRNALHEHLVAALARGSRAGTSVAVGAIDLDDFKSVNDTHGHPVGDAVLHEFARRVSGCIRDGDMLARVGGDEFIVVLEGISSSHPSDDLRAIMKRVDAAISAPVDMGDGVVVRNALSMGIALSPGHGTRPADLLRVADETLYGVKARKGDRSQWWELAALDG
ncbi:diguanylate cyclase (GGDEF)-like protein/PAS domain S-box-containing protein [Mycetocola sp. CAN_C7]|uniref:diguanylate cyclase domain-containing protein n=1 Tax=Mycetocola sp. CAN_C7 TaxID=2787724 RepID=UPI0018C97522